MVWRTATTVALGLTLVLGASWARASATATPLGAASPVGGVVFPNIFFLGQKLTSQGTPRRKGRCRNCGIYGHWPQDCKRPKREKGKEQKQPEANLAVAGGGVETGALLFAEVQGTVHGAPQFVHLSEEKVISMICPEGVWVLDTVASNHMTGTKSALSHLDESVSGSVRFGDGSTVKICGLGALVVQGKQNQHKVFTSVYYIPQLKSNIISLGHIEEGGCDIRLFNGRLSVLDPENNLLISAPRTGNRLYTLKLDADSPVCFLAKHTDPAWKWHARFGHLNFRSLRELGRLKMVEGMPLVDRVEQVCDGCTLGKQHRTPFPRKSEFRAQKGLELFHANLCGQIRPKTVGGKSYFLLVVDDYSRYMWVDMLNTKD